MEELRRELEIIKEPEKTKLILGGDFNARISCRGNLCDEKEANGKESQKIT